jgi:ribosome-associated translation inhibitor RaiA
MPARPFMRPAFESKKMQAVEAIKERIQKRIKRFEKVGK